MNFIILLYSEIIDWYDVRGWWVNVVILLM